VGRDGSGGVLIIMFVPAVVKCDKEEKEEKRHIFGLFGIAVKWP